MINVPDLPRAARFEEGVSPIRFRPREVGTVRRDQRGPFDHRGQRIVLHRFAAVRTDESLWVWGANTYGQLGNGTDASTGPTDMVVPTQVTTVAGVQQVWANSGTIFAVTHFVMVPDLSGQDQQQAADSLRSVGLRLGAIDTSVDSPACANVGNILGQNPASGRAVFPGTVVLVIVAVQPPSGCA